MERMYFAVKKVKGSGRAVAALGLMCLLTGCYTKAGGFADQLNPYADEGSALGDRTTDAISGGAGGKKAVAARQALEVMSTYQRASAPQPYYPVIKPAEVRLMWIPDHLNRFGDLIPAHYYYLNVLSDRPAVQDAFEIESQLNSTSRSIGGAVSGNPVLSAPSGDLGSNGGGSATPWQFQEKK